MHQEKLRAAITAVAAYLPPDKITNADLAKMVDTNDEWITTRTGIKERRILKGKNAGTSAMGIAAVKELCTKAKLAPEKIDLLICATVTPDYPFPATANIIAAGVGASNCFSYDLSAACSGFIYALATGASFIESGRYTNIVIVGADKMTSIMDYSDRTTCILFGDGCGAVLLQPTKENVGVMDYILKSDGSGAKMLYQPAGGSVRPADSETVSQKMHYVHQEGKSVFKFAVSQMADVSAEIMHKNHLTGKDIAWLVPHQANKRIIDATAKRMGIDESKVIVNIDRYGNTTAGTIPICLWELEPSLQKGDNLIIAAFGGGFTWGSIYLKWAYSPQNK